MKTALRGRVVTMDDAFSVVPDGVIYIEDESIAAVQAAGAKAPEGFADVKVVSTGGTIFPGLIDLHNHLAYDALPLWSVDKKYHNRDSWSGTVSYRAQVTGPMKVLGSSPDLLPALIRYVECKCLLGGVTTSQGIALFSNQGVRRYYKGLVRNVEQTTDADLPEALARIADVEKTNAKAFLARLKKASCLLLHLSEGTDDAARAHFLALRVGADWAIAKSLAGIHCVALQRGDFDVMAARGAAMVWSPLSNLLLYGATAKVGDARDAGVTIGLGADWSYSGSKNLLGELGIARIVAAGAIADRELVAMATKNGAKILGWDKVLGTLEKGKRADLIVIGGVAGDPYDALLRADESGLDLVVIDGVVRAATPELAHALEATGETVQVAGRPRMLALGDAAADPAVSALSLAKASSILEDALHRLPQLARALETAPTRSVGPFGDGPPTWYLALDELGETGTDLRPRLPTADGLPSGASRAAKAGAPLSEIVKSIDLDPITVADDPGYRARLATQKNLPEALRTALRGH